MSEPSPRPPLPASPRSPLWLALTTEADRARAEGLARAALERRLAACAALRPVQSLYHWQGAIETAEEVQILFKTDADHLHDLEQLVHQLHSYTCPQWISWPASAGSAYERWLAAELSGDGEPPGPEDRPGDEAPAG